MQLELRIQNAALAEAFRAHVERRLRFSLSRFGCRVGRVVVRVMSGGRVDSMPEAVFKIGIRLPSLGTVTVRETGADLFAAIDRAVGRAERSVTRRLEAGSEVRAVERQCERNELCMTLCETPRMEQEPSHGTPQLADNTREHGSTQEAA